MYLFFYPCPAHNARLPVIRVVLLHKRAVCANLSVQYCKWRFFESQIFFPDTCVWKEKYRKTFAKYILNVFEWQQTVIHIWNSDHTYIEFYRQGSSNSCENSLTNSDKLLKYLKFHTVFQTFVTKYKIKRHINEGSASSKKQTYLNVWICHQIQK